MDKVKKPPVLEFWLTMNRWVQFTRVMERCHRAAGGPVDRRNAWRSSAVTTWNGPRIRGGRLEELPRYARVV